MTPKSHALLASTASFKTAAADEYQFLMGKLDDVEHGRVMVAEVIATIRDGITRLSLIAMSAHDTAVVYAEPMSLASVPEPLVEPAPEAAADLAPQADSKDEEPAPSEPEQTTVDAGPGLYATRRKGDRTAV